mmetsp:Transcript_9531/g.19214  ORF Transcript_9531/g.19214 Transcript_9531/m.19214 type:complete len:227 (-) Transcript_9531:1630-2310(-)
MTTLSTNVNKRSCQRPCVPPRLSSLSFPISLGIACSKKLPNKKPGNKIKPTSHPTSNGHPCGRLQQRNTRMVPPNPTMATLWQIILPTVQYCFVIFLMTIEEKLGSVKGKKIAWFGDDNNVCNAGFTAWSSTREPKQVFTLLETVFAEFDRIAKQRRVFKVEISLSQFWPRIHPPPFPIAHALFLHECTRQLEIVTSVSRAYPLLEKITLWPWPALPGIVSRHFIL